MEHAGQSRMPDSLLHRELHRHHQRDGGGRAALRRDLGTRSRETVRWPARRPCPTTLARIAPRRAAGIRGSQCALRLFLPAGRIPPRGNSFLGPGAVHGQAVAAPVSGASAAQSRRGDGAARPGLQRAASGARRCAGDQRLLVDAPRLDSRAGSRGGRHIRAQRSKVAGASSGGSRGGVAGRSRHLPLSGRRTSASVRRQGRVLCAPPFLAHFSDARTGRRERKLKEEVRRIEWVETAGELGALLRELDDIKGLSLCTTGTRMPPPRAAR